MYIRICLSTYACTCIWRQNYSIPPGGMRVGWNSKWVGWIPPVAIPNPDQPTLGIFLTRHYFCTEKELIQIMILSFFGFTWATLIPMPLSYWSFGAKFSACIFCGRSSLVHPNTFTQHFSFYPDIRATHLGVDSKYRNTAVVLGMCINLVRFPDCHECPKVGRETWLV